MLEIRQNKKSSVLILELDGQLDSTSSVTFSEQMLGFIDAGGKNFVVDLSQLDYISSSGLRAFLTAAKRLGANGKIILCSTRDDVQKVFDTSGFATLFPMAGTQEEAIGLFRR